MKVKLEKTSKNDWTATGEGLVGQGASPMAAIEDLYRKVLDKIKDSAGGGKLRAV